MTRNPIVLLAATAWLLAAGFEVSAAEAVASKYRGWKTLKLSNRLVQLQVAPAIGGRIIQFTLAGFDYLWVNPQLAGKTPPPGRVGPNGRWLNYGGEKLWPAPQGWDNDRQWAGPPDPVLDGGPHAAVIVTRSGCPAAVKLTSEKDPRSGIQLSRTIELFDGSTRLRINAKMTNIDTKPRRWGIWSVVQHDAANRGGEGYDKNIRVYCPINPKSIFPKGYEVMFGLARNTQFQPDYKRGMMVVHYDRRVGKIGMDSSAGWLATVGGTAGYVFVQRFPFFPGKQYPDNCSVEVWLNGTGQCVIAGELVDMPDDPAENDYLVESEVLSPFAALKPGESYSFAHDWYAAAIGGDYPVTDCTEVGVTCEPLAARLLDGKLVLAGRFGVFYEGSSALVFLDASGERLGQAESKRPISPTRPLVLSKDVKIAAPPPGTVKVSLVVRDTSGRELGELARTRIR